MELQGAVGLARSDDVPSCFCVQPAPMRVTKTSRALGRGCAGLFTVVFAAGVKVFLVCGRWLVEMAVCWPAIHLHQRVGYGRMLTPVGLVRASARAAVDEVGAEWIPGGRYLWMCSGGAETIHCVVFVLDPVLQTASRSLAATLRSPERGTRLPVVSVNCTGRETRRLASAAERANLVKTGTSRCLGHRRLTRGGQGAGWLL